ncbi:MAG TPA: DUF503 domain-containing protein [Gammaproteobacteria bacterium]|nr:DUF503 domain-containing protein [Gammaproteobacteria bacterium]
MNKQPSAHIALTTIDLRIPLARSLKCKRRVVKSLKDRIRGRFNASVAEIAYLEEWQRCLLGVTMIGNRRRPLEQGHAALGRLLEETAEVQLVDVRMEWL